MPMDKVSGVDLIDVLKELTTANRELRSEIRQLREDFNPQIRDSKILELKAEEDRKAEERILKSLRKRKRAHETHCRLENERTAERSII